MLLPVHHDVHAPLTRDATEQFRVMCHKLREACFDERLRLEPELEPYLRVIERDGEELERIAEQLGVTLPRAGLPEAEDLDLRQGRMTARRWTSAWARIMCRQAKCTGKQE